MLLLQETYHLDSFIIYISGESRGRECGKASHYVCFKYMNSQWFCFNDDSIYTCDLPTIPMHIYMAFYRPMPTIGTQVVKDLNMANVAKLTKSQVTLMFEQRPMPVRRLTRTSGKNTSNIRPHEGTFVSNTSNSSFIARAKCVLSSSQGQLPPLLGKKQNQT